MSIETYLQKIKTAVLGKDVRGAIHDSIKQCYNDGKMGATDLVARDIARSAEASVARLINDKAPIDPNSEVAGIREGADGTVYSTAGDAVREQIRKLHSIEVSDTEPIRDNTHLWLRPSEIDSFELPEVKDGEVNSQDTWSSEKINNELSAVTKFLDSGVAKDLVEVTRSSETIETITGIDICNTTLATASQAYYNGFSPTKTIIITGFRVKDGTTATQFSLYVFNSKDELIGRYENIEPRQENNIVTLDSTIEVNTGGYVLIRLLNGRGYYHKFAESSFKEYRPGTKELIESPIQLGIEFIYSTPEYALKGAEYKITGPSSHNEYLLPKCKTDPNKPYTLVGRWFIDPTNPNAKTNTDGSSIIFKTMDTNQVTVILSAQTETEHIPYMAYSIDGGPFVRTEITRPIIDLPDVSEHFVWVVVDGMGENDPIAGGKWSGDIGVYVSSISGGGGYTKGVTFSNRQILFIGDSIVEGINALGAGSNAKVNSAINGFAFRTARKLNAMPILCGYGGTAVLGDASFHRPIEAIYRHNDLEMVQDDDYYPDIIVIEHGYNDNAIIADGRSSKELFNIEYNRLIDACRIKYPGAVIMCMIPFAQSLADEIRGCASNRPGCYLIETAGWNCSTSDGDHLDAAGAEKAATNLSKAIIDIMGKQYFYC